MIDPPRSPARSLGGSPEASGTASWTSTPTRLPTEYPQVHHLTAPLRAHGRSIGDADVVNLWAGQACALTSDRPAKEIVQRVANEARTALEHARQVLG